MALTPDELRKRIPQWSLESDGQLLQYMTQISKNLETKCKQTQNNMNRLLMEIDESHLRFANASNNFNGIQQLKYVENRVQDDDESFYSVREEEEEKGEKLPYGEIFQMVVEKSIANMYTSFEKVTVQLDSDSDSDDDEEEAAARNTVLRAVQKYPYISRPLPYIIGSQEWRDKWHAGLIDSEEESDTEPKEQYSDSSDSERMFPSQNNSNHTPSESEGSVWGVHSDPRRRAASMDPSVSGDDAFSIHSSSSAIRPVGTRSVIPNPRSKVPVLLGFRPPSHFPDQPPVDDTISVSSRRSKVANLFEESDDEDSTPTHRPTVAATMNTQPTYFRGNQVERKTVNLFADEPPPSSHESTPSSKSNRFQKKPVNLFIDSDEDDSFNNNHSSRNSSVYQSEPPELTVPTKKNYNLFDDDDKSDVTPKATGGKTVSDLFDKVNNNESDKEDGLFVPVKRSINGATDNVRRITNLFDDEPPEDDFDQIFKPKAADRKIPGAKLVLPPSLFGENRKEAVKKDTKHDVLEKQPNPTQRSVEPNPEISQPIARRKTNIFEEDDDGPDDIFSASVVKRQTKENAVAVKPKINLFDSENDESPPLLESKNSQVQVSAPMPTESITGQSNSIRSEIRKKKSIFDSDSNEDDEDDFLFGEKRTIPNQIVKNKQEPLPRKVESAGKTSSQQSIEDLNDKMFTVKIEDSDDILNIEKHDSKSQILEPDYTQVTSSTIRSEILKKKAIFESDSNEDEADEVPIAHKSTATALSHQEHKSNAHDVAILETTKKDHDLKISNHRDEITNETSIAKISVKPPIPDEPPDVLDDNEPNYPEVSNDIDYYLTTNKIDGPSELSVSTKLVQCANSDSNKTELKNSDANVIDDEPLLKTTDADSQPPSTINDQSCKTSVLQDSEHNGVHSNDSSSKSALNFNSIGLFDDIPPPDDCFEEAVDHADDGFYSAGPNAISNSIATSSVNTNQYLFMDNGDGPPPDDEVDDVKPSPSSIRESAPFDSISDLTEERNKNDSNYAGNRQKQKINRLSAKVNINVNALLPGARRPQPSNVVDKPEEKVSALFDVPISDHQIPKESQPKTEPDNVVGPAKLVSLNKGRAKIQTKRKPQSRQNRKSNYENSLAAGSFGDFSKHPSIEEVPKEEVRVVVGSEEKTQHVEVIAAHVQIEQLLSSEIMQKLSEPKLFDNNVDAGDKRFDVDDTTQIASNTLVPKNINSVAVPETVPKPVSKAPLSAKLFSDDDSDDDDLFGKISKPAAVRKPTVDKHEPDRIAKTPKPAAVPTTTSKKQSLFNDSDEDDDGLFSKAQPNRKPLSKPTASNDEATKIVSKATKSIFGSDGGSDSDDIFGGSKKGVAASSSSGVSKAPKTAALPSRNKSLFGEDDDDDDLFSSKSKSAPKPTSSQPTTTTKKVYRNPSTSAKTIDDPLADLLK